MIAQYEEAIIFLCSLNCGNISAPASDCPTDPGGQPRMNILRTIFLIVAGIVGQCFSSAATAECYYGSDRYSEGTVLCQAGLRMQCLASAEGKPVWASMEQQCTVPALAVDGATEPKGPLEAESRRYQSNRDASPAASRRPAASIDTITEAIGETNGISSVGSSSESRSRATPGLGSNFVIEILWATYGRDGHTCDAAPAVMKRCNGKAACELDISADAFCEDSYLDRTKLLSVYWHCANSEKSIMKAPKYGQDKSQITLQCS